MRQCSRSSSARVGGSYPAPAQSASLVGGGQDGGRSEISGLGEMAGLKMTKGILGGTRAAAADLSTHIPDGHAEIAVRDSLYVEADRRDGGHKLTQLELVERAGLPGSVQSKHEDARRVLEVEQGLARKERGEQGGHHHTHR